MSLSVQQGDNLLQIEDANKDEESQSVESATELKHSKATEKTAFTEERRALLVLIQQREVTLDAIQEVCGTLDMAQKEAMVKKYRTDKSSNCIMCDYINDVEI